MLFHFDMTVRYLAIVGLKCVFRHIWEIVKGIEVAMHLISQWMVGHIEEEKWALSMTIPENAGS